jgi:hypothetical protein
MMFSLDFVGVDVAAVGQVDLFGLEVLEAEEPLALEDQPVVGVLFEKRELEVLASFKGLLEGVEDLVHLEGGVLEHAV